MLGSCPKQQARFPGKHAPCCLQQFAEWTLSFIQRMGTFTERERGTKTSPADNPSAHGLPFQGTQDRFQGLYNFTRFALGRPTVICHSHLSCLSYPFAFLIAFLKVSFSHCFFAYLCLWPWLVPFLRPKIRPVSLQCAKWNLIAKPNHLEPNFSALLIDNPPVSCSKKIPMIGELFNKASVYRRPNHYRSKPISPDHRKERAQLL